MKLVKLTGIKKGMQRFAIIEGFIPSVEHTIVDNNYVVHKDFHKDLNEDFEGFARKIREERDTSFLQTQPLHYFNIVQKSPEWFALRNQFVTSSSVPKLDDKIKQESVRVALFSKEFDNHIGVQHLRDVASEEAKYTVHQHMNRGNTYEDEARKAFEFLTNKRVKEIGFTQHPKLECFGSSLDGKIIGENSLIEIKVPRIIKFLTHQQHNIMLATYYEQMQHQMLTASAQKCYFWVYSPYLQKGVLRIVERDVDYMDKLLDIHDKISQYVKVSKEIILSNFE